LPFNGNRVDKIIQVASAMGVVIDVSSFNDVHRLGVNGPGQNRQIIVRFMQDFLTLIQAHIHLELKLSIYKMNHLQLYFL
jgi:hypothetical protein